LEFCWNFDISRVSEAITAKRMKIDPYCQRRNCSPLNVLFSDVYVDIAGRSPTMGRQTNTWWGKKLFSSQYHSPDGADIAAFFVFRHGAINL